MGEVRPHPNPKVTRLSLISVYGNQVVVGIDTKPGDKVVYFPVECAISAEYLTWANEYRVKSDGSSLNADKDSKGGYFEENRRVKAVRLQGETSQGIVIPVAKVAEFFNVAPDVFKVGVNFDTVGDKILVEKYIVHTSKVGESKEPRDKKDAPGITKLLKANQFRFHSKTTNLGMAVHVIRPSDIISISSKAHGTSAVYGNLFCSRTLSWKDKVAKWLGAKIVEEEYRFVYSSRSVVKNRKDGKWTEDVWGRHGQELEPLIPFGFTLYGEIVGYASAGKQIQKNYDYGMPISESDFWVYRITHTDTKGEVMELDWQQIHDFCKARNINVVPTYFHGKAGDLFDLDPEDSEWNSKFLAELKETFLDKKCELCKNDVIREGICLRVENSSHKNAWKFKSPLFLVKESADRDKGEINIEEES